MPEKDDPVIKKPGKIMFAIAIGLLVKVFFFPEKLFELGYIHWRSEMFLVIVLVFMAIAGGAVWDQMKYRSPLQVGHGLSTSLYRGDVHRVGNWVVTRRGGIDVHNFNDKGREGIAVFPDLGYEWLSDNALAKVVFEKVSISQLPKVVRQYVRNEGLPTNSIKFATAIAEIEHSNKAFIDWKSFYKKYNSLDDKLEQMTEKIMDKSTEAVEWSKDISTNEQMGTIQRKLEELKDKKKGD